MVVLLLWKTTEANQPIVLVAWGCVRKRGRLGARVHMEIDIDIDGLYAQVVGSSDHYATQEHLKLILE